MTYRELYRDIVETLKQGECDSPEFDAGCLLSHFTGIERGMLPIKGGEQVPVNLTEQVLSAARQRTLGRPLQYILGSWDFLNLTLEVGEGVLIPRADTELLVETAAEYLKSSGILNSTKKPAVLDLCSGSGCVALGLASLVPGINVTAVELSPKAFEFLSRNCRRYPEYDVKPVMADVLEDADKFEEEYAAILSNPPYIPRDQLEFLMREVKYEPEMALDGCDGLVFYRVIAKDWVPKLVKGGICAVEVGIGQAQEVAGVFLQAGLKDIKIFKDINGIERVVTGNAL